MSRWALPSSRRNHSMWVNAVPAAVFASLPKSAASNAGSDGNDVIRMRAVAATSAADDALKAVRVGVDATRQQGLAGQAHGARRSTAICGIRSWEPISITAGPGVSGYRGHRREVGR